MDDRMDHSTEAQCSESDREGDDIEATGVYETQGGIVLYDMDRPLAWVQGDNAIELAEMR